MIADHMLRPAVIGEELLALAVDQAEWSQATFGTDAELGPTGALRHIQLECDEAIAEPDKFDEYADILILLLDASRRAGMSPADLVRAARAKMVVNKARKYAKAKPGQPSLHIKE